MKDPIVELAGEIIIDLGKFLLKSNKLTKTEIKEVKRTIAKAKRANKKNSKR